MKTPKPIDWKQIRPLKGSQQSGFEELCSQLARADRPSEARFIRKAPPDSGVECFAVFPDGREWAWQAKYFDRLGNSQWAQLDKSVKKALDGHPELVRYYVCLPMDLPDGRKNNSRSALKRWEERKCQWLAWARERQMQVEFEFWGSSELLDMLREPKHLGLVHFWFGEKGFDTAWFDIRLSEAVEALGPRYTPELHVELPIAQSFAILGRNQVFAAQFKELVQDLRSETRIYQVSSSPEAPLREASQKFKECLNRFLAASLPAIVEPNGTGWLPVTSVKTLRETWHELFKTFVATQSPVLGADELTISAYAAQKERMAKTGALIDSAAEFIEKAWSQLVAPITILRGDAGMGKSHLLCDVARQRLAEGRPTLLLLGERFTSTIEPWTQVLQMMDLRELSVAEMIGALEAAAQVADCQALVLIDALNEGRGPEIWPAHLASFLEPLIRSEWIAPVIAVRSAYENLIPPALRSKGVFLDHQGFQGRVFDAMTTYFEHYKIELPSTPLLAPEFHNALFLKTLCEGLQGRGESHLPRGFHGFSLIFGLYLKRINERVALQLDYEADLKLLDKSLKVIARAFIDAGTRWLSVEHVMGLLEPLLPNRGGKQSLYRALIAEGLLMRDRIYHDPDDPEEVVLVAYERYADHLIARYLIDTYLTLSNPADALTDGSPLRMLLERPTFLTPGLLEALSIQVPERTGQELFQIAPFLNESQSARHAFIQSLIWRAASATTELTKTLVAEFLFPPAPDAERMLNALVTVTSIPEHPLNAQFLDRLLRQVARPERDAVWSLFLYNAWASPMHNALSRLLDWVLALTNHENLEFDTVKLFATTLLWCLSTSHRFLRDRATKALVHLLTQRLDILLAVLPDVEDIDDLYIQERVYAVAYGSVMRSQDIPAIITIAQRVYLQVFADNVPPTHVLLRDYARGIIERALDLCPTLEIESQLIRPPYFSAWPAIPNPEEMLDLQPDWSRGNYEQKDIYWAHNATGSSVLHGHFARHVIGVGASSFPWLNQSLKEAVWLSPRQRLEKLLSKLPENQRKAWTVYRQAKVNEITVTMTTRLTLLRAHGSQSGIAFSELENYQPDFSRLSPDQQDLAQTELKARLNNLSKARRQLAIAKKKMLQILMTSQLGELQDLQQKIEQAKPDAAFDVAQMQRYILWRVHDLGWTLERFGNFDRFIVPVNYQDSGKPERIGKKYQWLAFHEFLAYLSDHFQYHDPHEPAHGSQLYEGPWQENWRDIDPSLVTVTSSEEQIWWETIVTHEHAALLEQDDWALSKNDLPDVASLLRVRHPETGLVWLNLHGNFSWLIDENEHRRREIWYQCRAYVVPLTDEEAVLKWGKRQNFWGKWMPEPPECYGFFLGEYPWAPAAQAYERAYQHDYWDEAPKGCPTRLTVAAWHYRSGSNGYDCSVLDSEREDFLLLCPELVRGMKLHWSGQDGQFLTMSGQLAAYSPHDPKGRTDPLLVREDLLQDYLAQKGLALCWILLGEKEVNDGFFGRGTDQHLRLSGFYMLKPSGVIGDFRTFVES